MLNQHHLRHSASFLKYSIITGLMFIFLLVDSNITFADDNSRIIASAECCKPSSIYSGITEAILSYEEVTEITEIQRQSYYERTNIPGKFDEFEEIHKDEISLLAAIIASEAACVDQELWCSQATKAGITPDIWQQYVGYCVMNRVYQTNYPDTIRDVFYQKGQYAETSIERVENGFVTERCINNAIIVLKNYYNNTVPVPRNMVYQAEFEQGSKVFLKVGKTRFCLDENLPSE